MSEPKKMTYSFSRVNTFLTCPYSFYASYIEKEEQWQNGWGVGGSYSHQVIEDVLSGKIEASEALEYWDKNVPDLEFPFMKTSYITKYVDKTRDFFRTFSGINNEILGIERHFEVDIDGISFQGLIDLETRSDEGDMVITDWKFAAESGFSGKKLKEKARQLYLYSIPFKEKFGEYPSSMYFYLCLSKKAIKIDFNEKDLQEAIDWLKDGVAKIEAATEYNKEPQSFYCRNLCGVQSCEFNGQYKH
jgi:RecB family exonuclease